MEKPTTGKKPRTGFDMVFEALRFMKYEDPDGFEFVLANIIDVQFDEICRLVLKVSDPDSEGSVWLPSDGKRDDDEGMTEEEWNELIHSRTK